MHNAEIAAALEDIAELLEMEGANRFRIRAYRNAARTLETMTRPVAAMVERGEDLTTLPGIGAEMSRHVTEMVETGSMRYRDELTRDMPASILQLTRVPGLGPKKAAQLWKALGIDTIDRLEAEIQSGRVQTVPGFGAKSGEKILAAIARMREIRERVPLVEVEDVVAGLTTWLGVAPGVDRVEAAGSFRRRRDTVADVDLLAR